MSTSPGTLNSSLVGFRNMYLRSKRSKSFTEFLQILHKHSKCLLQLLGQFSCPKAVNNIYPRYYFFGALGVILEKWLHLIAEQILYRHFEPICDCPTHLMVIYSIYKEKCISAGHRMFPCVHFTFSGIIYHMLIQICSN